MAFNRLTASQSERLSLLAEECLQMLRHLQEAGYNVPDHAMEMLAEEVEE